MLRADCRKRERAHRHGPFAGDIQPFAAGGQHANTGGGAEQALRQGRGRRDQMFAVVEHEQHLPAGEVLAQRLDVRLVGPLVDAEGGGNGQSQALRVRKRRQIHEPHAVRE